MLFEIQLAIKKCCGGSHCHAINKCDIWWYRLPVSCNHGVWGLGCGVHGVGLGVSDLGRGIHIVGLRDDSMMDDVRSLSPSSKNLYNRVIVLSLNSLRRRGVRRFISSRSERRKWCSESSFFLAVFFCFILPRKASSTSSLGFLLRLGSFLQTVVLFNSAELSSVLFVIGHSGASSVLNSSPVIFFKPRMLDVSPPFK